MEIKVIEAHVEKGSIIWTDGHASYAWLDEADSGYTHESVIHRRGEFAKLKNSANVSTNAIEGMFALAKRLLRQYMANIRKILHFSFASYYRDCGF